jgi:hypothetical protein
VILVDANLLVYAHVATTPEHDRARSWLDQQLSGRTKVGLPWPSLLGYMRLVTNPRIFQQPALMSEAWAQVQSWLSAGPAWIPVPTDRHGEVLASLIASVPKSNLIPDAHLAALAIEHGLSLASTDGDFARFPGLRWFNPLRPS